MIGIFGGTFNPIHVGHLRAAEEVVEALALERMLFVPSARPPHKPSDRQEIAPAQLRLRWVELAVRDNPHFAVDPIEVERPGPSYLVDTLHALRERHREPDGLVFVVGQDAFSEMGTWHMPREIFRLCHVAVTTRPPVLSGRLGEWLPECVRGDFAIEAGGTFARHREAATTIRQVAITAIDVSASAIRERIQAGRSIRYLLPETVRSAVLASGAYLGEAPAAHREDAAARSASGGES